MRRGKAKPVEAKAMGVDRWRLGKMGGEGSAVRAGRMALGAEGAADRSARRVTTFEISVRFFLQLAVVLVACRAVSALARRVGQPPVVGEMIAGVLLGPSLLGLIAPGVQVWIFPAGSKAVLFAGAQVGLVLYMFCVGLEFRLFLPPKISREFPPGPHFARKNVCSLRTPAPV